jgi:hypothetical protein
MGVFDDKKFEQLDWMTQITETIESELNGLLARLPDQIELNAAALADHVSGEYFSIEIDSVIRHLMLSVPGGLTLSQNEEQKLVDCFKFEGSPTIEFNAGTGELAGSIVLVKSIPTLSDEELQTFMGLKGINEIGSMDIGEAENWNLERMNEILDVLGDCDADKRNRSFRKKLRRIEKRLMAIFSNNEWRVRDMELADRIGYWVANYIKDGNLASLTNLCKLKIMTHSNMPIYSMEEEL